MLDSHRIRLTTRPRALPNPPLNAILHRSQATVPQSHDAVSSAERPGRSRTGRKAARRPQNLGHKPATKRPEGLKLATEPPEAPNWSQGGIKSTNFPRSGLSAPKRATKRGRRPRPASKRPKHGTCPQSGVRGPRPAPKLPEGRKGPQSGLRARRLVTKRPEGPKLGTKGP
jgi:hypothetical protein